MIQTKKTHLQTILKLTLKNLNKKGVGDPTGEAEKVKKDSKYDVVVDEGDPD